MNKRLIFSVILICLLTFVAVLAFSQNSPNVRWEYTTLNRVHGNYQFTERANNLGQQGWDLVAFNDNHSVYKSRLP